MHRLILASGSASRRSLLENAGLEIEIIKPCVDEEEIKLALKDEGASAMDVALTLAEMKGLRVSHQHSEAYVIAGDQMLDLEGQWFDKPKDLKEAAEHLAAFSGRTHSLETAVCLLRNGQRLWHHGSVARLTMRPLSAAFIEDYIERCGEVILSSVGAYHLEGHGAQLFARIEGDFFAILGLPLLPVLDILRENGVLKT